MDFFYKMYQGGVGVSKYIVKSGDSLYKIANEYGLSVEELMNLNNLQSTMIYPNQILMVPYVKNSSMVVDEYVTKSGDTIGLIADKFQIDPDTLKMMNNYQKLELAPNQVLNLGKQKYKIQDDDTTNGILSKTGNTAYELIELNKNDWLKPGKTIIVK